MVAKGGPKPKFVNPADKHAVSEGENGFITFTVEGNPAPSVEWFKGFKDLSVEPRYVKMYNFLGKVPECRQNIGISIFSKDKSIQSCLTHSQGGGLYELSCVGTSSGPMERTIPSL